MDSLNTKNIDLSLTQQQIIIDILNEKRLSGEIKSDEEYNAELENMLGQLASGEPMTKLRKQEGLTNPRNFTRTMQEAAIDVMTAFSQINQVDQTVNKHQQLNQSIIGNLKLSMKKASDELRRQEALVDIVGSEDFVFEGFRDSNSFETDASFYTERSGAPAPMAYQVRLDTEREAIKLPAIVSENGLIGASGVRLGNIQVGTQFGGGLIRIQNPEHDVNKAIDESYETFWSESILVDEPLRVTYSQANLDTIRQGAVCELLINFDYLTQLNEISFQPFTEFPMSIVSIGYWGSDDPTEHVKILPDVYADAMNEAVVFQFNDIVAKRIQVILNQVHYTKTDFIVNNQEAERLKLWYASKEDPEPDALEINPRFQQKPLYQNKSESSKGYVYFQTALKNLSTDLNELIDQQEDKSVTPMTKYAYNYGLYNLGIQRNEFQDKGIYISKPISVAGNLKSVRLDTSEEHPFPDGFDNIITNIEYYIGNTDDNTWLPILSEATGAVRAELLVFQTISGQLEAKTRFSWDVVFAVYKNGMELDQADYSIEDASHTITINGYDGSATYTVNYEPAESAYEIDFLELFKVGGNVRPNRAIDESFGTDALGRVMLTHYPFVDRAQLNAQSDGWEPSFLSNTYLPFKIKVIEDDGRHIDQPFAAGEVGLKVLNRTNYLDPENSALNPYNPEAGYEYKVEGNQVIFNTPLPDNVRVIAEYPHLVSTIRLKAILRRNINALHGLTPLLNDYTVYYQRLL